jgi:hypothetical protein
MLLSVCKSRITIARQTSELFDSQAASASITVSRNPDSTATVQVKKSGTATAGTVTITGTITTYDSSTNEPSSSAVTETLTMDQYESIAITVSTFDTVSTVECSAALVSAGVTILCNYVGTDGGSIETQYAVTNNYPAQFVRNNADLSDPISGSNESERALMLMPYDTSFSPKVTDVVTNDVTSEKYFIEGVPLIEQIGIAQHWRVIVARDKNL